MRSPVAYPFASRSLVDFTCTSHESFVTVATTVSLSWRTP